MGEARSSALLLAPLLGGHPGRVPDAFEALAPVLRRRGHPVVVASTRVPRGPRLADMLGTLARHRRHVEVAVVHVYGGNAFAVAEVLQRAARAAGLPVVGFLSGGRIPEMAVQSPGRVRRVLAGFDAVAAPSAFMVEVAAGVGVEAQVIPNVLDPGRYRFRPRRELRPRVLWMRTFHDVYRPLDAVRAFAVVHRERPDATLTMAGQDKGLRAEAEAEAERMGLGAAVTFPGFLDAAAKLRAFDEHDVYLHTNALDNAPVTLQEAGGAGLVLVATRVGGVPHLVGAEAATLVPAGEPDALAAAVLEVLADPDLAARRSAAAHELARAASPERVGPAWSAVLDRLGRTGPAR